MHVSGRVFDVIDQNRIFMVAGRYSYLDSSEIYFRYVVASSGYETAPDGFTEDWIADREVLEVETSGS